MPTANLTQNGFYTHSVEADYIQGEGTFTPLPKYDKAKEVPLFAGLSWRVVPIADRDAYVPPVPVEPPESFGSISDRQFFQALAMAPYAIISTQEALDAVKTGEIPAIMQAVVDQLPADRQFAATMILAGGTTYERANDLVGVFGASQGMTPAQIDAFWRFAEGL